MPRVKREEDRSAATPLRKLIEALAGSRSAASSACDVACSDFSCGCCRGAGAADALCAFLHPEEDDENGGGGDAAAVDAFAAQGGFAALRIALDGGSSNSGAALAAGAVRVIGALGWQRTALPRLVSAGGGEEDAAVSRSGGECWLPTAAVASGGAGKPSLLQQLAHLAAGTTTTSAWQVQQAALEELLHWRLGGAPAARADGVAALASAAADAAAAGGRDNRVQVRRAAEQLRLALSRQRLELCETSLM